MGGQHSKTAELKINRVQYKAIAELLFV